MKYKVTCRKLSPPICCPFCGARVDCVDSEQIYGAGHSYGYVWRCSRFPECDSSVGCHMGTKEPYGTLANKELRGWRMAAHDPFDVIWKQAPIKQRNIHRRNAYKRLSILLGIPKSECHIGRFDVERCKQAVEILKKTRI